MAGAQTEEGRGKGRGEGAEPMGMDRRGRADVLRRTVDEHYVLVGFDIAISYLWGDAQ